MSLSADATLLTRGRDPYVIAAALLLDEIIAGELDVESGCVDGEPIADWIDRFSRIAPPRIIADLVRQGHVTPRRFSLSVDARAEAEARLRAEHDAILGTLLATNPLPPTTHTLPAAVQDVLSAVRVSHRTDGAPTGLKPPGWGAARERRPARPGRASTRTAGR